MSRNYFTAGPSDVPAGFTKPSKRFKTRIALAMFGLLSFAFVYIYMMVWFATQAIVLFELSNTGESPFFYVITGICFIVLAVFMFKSLIFFNKRSKISHEEITRETEPELVDFIHQVADEIGAPKPKHIYLSDRVNACVFYDLSFLNLLLPTRKNLEVGLGLMNVLNVSEFKAILAHEFGHFSQRSMLFGRYVYVAQQVAFRIVNKRDALDNGLSVLSRIDIRIAWIGWILSIIVWAIRAFIEVLFSLVVISERALSREMEFHADRVAVSVTGSDPLVYALHKLRAADEGYHAGIDTLNHLIHKNQVSPDLYALQSNYIQHMRRILDDADFGATPIGKNGQSKQVFRNALINPPEMWSTHPSDMDREKNAKSSYIASHLDVRSAMEIFKDPKNARERVTERLIRNAEIKQELEKVSDDEACALMNHETFEWAFLDPAYKGWYLNRSSMLHFKSADELIEASLPSDLTKFFSTLYTEEMKEKLDLHQELQEEISMLKAAKEQVGTVENRKIVHRGKQIRRRKIPEILNDLQAQELEVRGQIMDYERQLRTAHYAAAKRVAPDAARYYASIIRLLHYTEHSKKILQEANKHLQHTLYVVLADGKVSNDELNAVRARCRDLRNPMERIQDEIGGFELSEVILKRLHLNHANELLGNFSIPDLDVQNIDYWVNNYQPWLETIINGIQRLRNAALEHLLSLEKEIGASYVSGKPGSVQAGKVFTVSEYPTLVTGDEPPLLSKLRFWDKFQGGIGFFPTMAKFAAAGAIIFGAMYIGSDSLSTDLYIHNGLQTAVVVTVDGELMFLESGEDRMLEMYDDAQITARTKGGVLIDDFVGELDDASKAYVYNVGNGSYFMEYEAYYGNVDYAPEPIYIGAQRWIVTDAEHIFEDAPNQLKVYGTSATRNALVYLDEQDPSQYPALEFNNPATKQMIINHVLHDRSSSQYLSSWTNLAANSGNQKSIVQRLETHPDDVNAWRTLMDAASDAERKKMGQDFKRKFEKSNEANFWYLYVRTLEDGPQQDAEFLEAYQRFPRNAWLAQAAGSVFAKQGKWEQSLNAYELATKNSIAVRNLILSYRYRLDRIVNGPISSVKFRFYNDDYYLTYIQQLEDGVLADGFNPIDLVYYELSSGNVQTAADAIDNYTGSDKASFQWYLAASRGASQEDIDKALGSNFEESIHSGNVLCAAGVLARFNREAECKAMLENYYAMNETDWKLLEAMLRDVRAGSLNEAESKMRSTDSFVTHFALKLIACVLLQEKAPERWIKEVNACFMANERPWLGIAFQSENPL